MGTALLQLSSCSVDFTARLVHRDGAACTLSTREAALLQYLTRGAGRDLSRGELYREVWGYAEDSRSRTLDITIARLRKKIEQQASQPIHLLTLPGIGYRFELRRTSAISPTERCDELIGRDEEIDQLCSLLEKGPTLLSILGPPGVGKNALASALSRHRPGLAILDEASAGEIDELRRLNPGRLLIATSRRALRLQGEHRFELGPLSVEQGASLLASRLCTGQPNPDETEALRRAATVLEGNPQLLIELCESLSDRSRDEQWITSLQFLKLSQWIEPRLLSWKGAFRASLEEDFAALNEEAQNLLTNLAQSAATFSGEELVSNRLSTGDTRIIDLLQELREASALQGLPGHRFVIPLPMRTYVRVRSAERANARTRS